MNGPADPPKADWYPDPSGRYEYRFHNGERWTADVSVGGERLVDVLVIGAPAARRGRDGGATAAMVLGIVALAISWMPYIFVVGTICAVLALIFGGAALRRRRPDDRGFAMTGVITGGAALVMAVLGVVMTRVVADAIDRFEDPPPFDVDITSCRISDGSLVVEGTIANIGSDASDYRVIVRIPGARLLETRRVVFEVDDLEPGESATFEGSYRIDDTLVELGAEPSCDVADVTGPLPFGVDPG